MLQRKYFTPDEVKRLLDAAHQSQHAERNRCLIAMGYLHGFRISELLQLRLSDIDLPTRTLNVHRLKSGFSTIHPILASEARLIRAWLRARQVWAVGDSDALFISRSGNVISRQQGYNILNNLGKKAGFSLCAHPHMLRHACGYALADNGVDTRLIQDYLGHRNIRHTVLYTASNAARFEGVWRDKRRGKSRQLVPKCHVRTNIVHILSENSCTWQAFF